MPNIVGNANMLGNAYLKYVFTGDATHTNKTINEGIKYISSLYFFLYIK